MGTSVNVISTSEHGWLTNDHLIKTQIITVHTSMKNKSVITFIFVKKINVCLFDTYI